MRWQPRLGAWPVGNATRFRVWAPKAQKLEVLLETVPERLRELPLDRSADGFFEGTFAEIRPGDLYRYRVDGEGPYPDPASRYQPLGVHGPSQVVNPGEFPWTDAAWRGIPLGELVLYELHVGTFTPEGTFAAVRERLPYLQELGITAIELMPVADFPGNHNWGYDGVALFAPAPCYGTPDDLRQLVNAAHELGMAVHLDVVYNHFGPDGAYMGAFSPYYFSSRHRSPWGAGINFDGPHSGPVREFCIENALHWIHDCHIDGLRLDATHAIVDESPRHILAELTAAVRSSLQGSRRRALVIAEDVRNLAHMVKSEVENGWGLDAVWSDDFHHQMRRCLVGDRDGYFQDFQGTMQDIATTARKGWFYTGQYAPFFEASRGTNPAGIPPRQFVFFLQNHDQVGNRAFGERLHHQIELAAYRAATTLLLLLPQTPLLFMGQEWAASTPFQFFADHHPELGKLVTAGRRQEFSRFAAFADPQLREKIPDPQDQRTFEASWLLWEERQKEPHVSTLRFYQQLLALRRKEPALRTCSSDHFEVQALDEDGLLVQRRASSGPTLLAVIRLRGSGAHDLREVASAQDLASVDWELLWTTEDSSVAPDPTPVRVKRLGPTITFSRPGAVILKIKGEPGRKV